MGALVALLSVAFGPLDVLVPDTHHGEGSIVHASAENHAPETPASERSGDREDGHPLHVDHCSHSHVSLPLNAGFRIVHKLPAHGELRLLPAHYVSIILPRQQRPPIA